MTKGRRQPPPAAPPSEEVRAKPPFELRYTSDAAADIKALDGSVRNQLRKVLEKKLAVAPEGYGLSLRASLAGYWKHQFGNHRVVYRIYPQHHIVVVCRDRKSTRLNSSHGYISYAVFCLKKKTYHLLTVYS